MRLLVSSPYMASLALASPLACCSRVTFRDSPKWRGVLETSTQLQDLLNGDSNEKGKEIIRSNQKKKKPLCASNTPFFLNILGFVVARLGPETSQSHVLWTKCRMCLAVHVHVHVHVSLQFIFTFPAASIFHFVNTAITFSCFLPTKFVSSGFYLPLFGLSLLSTSVKTLKFSGKKNLTLLFLLKQFGFIACLKRSYNVCVI